MCHIIQMITMQVGLVVGAAKGHVDLAAAITVACHATVG
jgi:hypothetical protein